MSHFSVLVLTRETDESRFKDEVTRLIAPYDENMETEPRWEPADLAGMTQHYGTSDLNELAAHMEDWSGKEGRVVEGRLEQATTYNPQSKWDWWQIGGRWSGHLDPTYDPQEDPRNIEICTLCDGTGKRTDDVGRLSRLRDPDYTCNGCRGTGRHPKWPTDWAPAPGNSAPVARVIELCRDGTVHLPYAIVTPEGAWNERGEMGWFGTSTNEKDDWPQVAMALLEHFRDCTAIVVDCHI